MQKRKPWRDVPRLMQMRNRVGDLQAGVATSVTAFLAWKAFLITAKSCGTGAERERCISRIAEAISLDHECQHVAGRFADGLLLLADQSNVAVAEWLAVDDDDEVTRDGRVARFKRDVRRMSPRARNSPLPIQDRFTIAECAVAFRHSVIAHGSVHSTGNLFQLIVPPFDDLVCAVTYQGYAQRLGLSLDEVKNDCTVKPA